MSALQLQTPTASTGRRQVFVSYSRLDERLVGEFMKQFGPSIERNQLEVYYDAQRPAGEIWNDVIEAALRRCDLFLLFVSPHSLTGFCMERELLLALDRAAQGRCTIVPVILSPCDWKRKLLPNGTGRTLGSFNALPKDARPMTEFDGRAGRAKQWLYVIDRIEALLTGPAPAATPAAAAAAAATRAVPELLPYLCDQQPPDWAIHQLLTQWQAQPVPLVLVMRGHVQDCPDKFAERIVERRLKKLLDRVAPGFGLQRHLGLQWPMPSLKLDGPQLEAFFLQQLAERVMEDGWADEAQLVAHLQQGALHRLFLVGLPREDTAYLKRSTRALAAVLGRVAPKLAPRRLACLLWSEDAAFKQSEPEADWSADGTGALIGLPAPLMAFDMDDVRQWAAMDEVQRVRRLPREALEQAFAGSPPELTMHDFVRTIAPVLASPD